MGTIFLTTYAGVLGAELGGDRLFLAVGVLASRFRYANVALGVTAAFMLKMLAAVAIGTSVGDLPKPIVVTVSALAFLSVAYRLCRPESESDPSGSASSGTLESFSALAFTEWGDVGQVSAAAMAARFHAPLLVWMAAVAAMMTKSFVAIGLTWPVRRWHQIAPNHHRVRAISSVVFVTLAVVSIAEMLAR